jgi:site-specific recombinase XerD
VKDGALFRRISKTDRILEARLTDAAVRFIFEERAALAGITEKFSCHDWRRSCISELLDAGVDIATASKIAGHSSVTTTQKYDRRGEEAKKNAVQQLEF